MTDSDLHEMDLAARRENSWEHLLDTLAQLAEDPLNEDWRAMLRRRGKTLWVEWREACDGQRELYREDMAA